MCAIVSFARKIYITYFAHSSIFVSNVPPSRLCLSLSHFPLTSHPLLRSAHSSSHFLLPLSRSDRYTFYPSAQGIFLIRFPIIFVSARDSKWNHFKRFVLLHTSQVAVCLWFYHPFWHPFWCAFFSLQFPIRATIHFFAIFAFKLFVLAASVFAATIEAKNHNGRRIPLHILFFAQYQFLCAVYSIYDAVSTPSTTRKTCCQVHLNDYSGKCLFTIL